MSRPQALELFAALPPMGLDEVMAAADLQVRKDRKYLIDPGDLGSVIEAVAGEASALTIDGLRSFAYESTYFDTSDFSTYLAAARSRPRRYKVRTRAYLDSSTCQLEVKVRAARGHTVKHRTPYDFEIRGGLTEGAACFIESVPEVDGVVHGMAPALRVRYERSTLILSSSTTRVTVDLDLGCRRPDGATVTFASVAFIETKTHGPPSLLDRVLWRSGYRPVSVSKYCLGLAALVPDLPANKWHRLLHQHCHPLTDRPQPTIGSENGNLPDQTVASDRVEAGEALTENPMHRSQNPTVRT